MGSRAIIEEIGGKESYYVSEGDIFADEIKVVDIDGQVVKLDRSGENMELRLGDGTWATLAGGALVQKRNGILARMKGQEVVSAPGRSRHLPERCKENTPSQFRNFKEIPNFNSGAAEAMEPGRASDLRCIR